MVIMNEVDLVEYDQGGIGFQGCHQREYNVMFGNEKHEQ